jgi:hypothetical protein
MPQQARRVSTIRRPAASRFAAAAALAVPLWVPLFADPLPEPNRLVLEGAREWLRRGFRYDTAYVRLPFPGGDVPGDRGACTDLVVRALRHAGIDLQVLIHEDRRAHPSAYPDRPIDPNLDHRLTAMQVPFLRRHARSLTTRTVGGHLQEWLPGDLVYYGKERPWHTGIVSDRRHPSGVPYIIDSHQDGPGVSERFLLTRWGAILGHFRVPGDLLPPRGAARTGPR